MNISWEWQLRLEALRDGVFSIVQGTVRLVRFIWRFVSSAGFLGGLSLVATIASAIAAFFTWQAAESANKVAEASQAFAQKIYNDQIALGHPSISVLSGETFVSEERHDSYSDQVTKSYAATIVLRNSGLRDTARAWVALSADRGFNYTDDTDVALVALPKDTDVPVRFDLHWPPRADLYRSSWYVGFVYEDEVPVEALGPASVLSTKAPSLHITCSEANVVKVSSWPKKLAQNESVRTLSPGSPIAVGRMAFDQYGRPIASTTAEAIRNKVIGAIRQAGACSKVAY